MTIRTLLLLAAGTLVLGTLALARQQTASGAKPAIPLNSTADAHPHIMDDAGCPPNQQPRPWPIKLPCHRVREIIWRDSRPLLVMIPPKLAGTYFSKGQTYQVALEVGEGGLIYADSCDKD